jgi:hypothetical protein
MKTPHPFPAASAETKIVRILKWGSGEWQTVLLACGHRCQVRRAEVKAQQLLPGKAMKCEKCEAKA